MSKTESVIIETSFGPDYAENLKGLIEVLGKEKEKYTKNKNIGDVAFYDAMKKRVFSYFSTLDTYFRTMQYEQERVEEIVKKEIKNRIMLDLASEKLDSGKKRGITAAERMVENNPEYMDAKRQLWEIKRQYRWLSGRHNVFYELYKSIVQSVSIAGKEQKDTAMAN